MPSDADCDRPLPDGERQCASGLGAKQRAGGRLQDYRRLKSARVLYDEGPDAPAPRRSARLAQLERVDHHGQAPGSGVTLTTRSVPSAKSRLKPEAKSRRGDFRLKPEATSVDKGGSSG
jgi:hypothetical protein